MINSGSAPRYLFRSRKAFPGRGYAGAQRPSVEDGELDKCVAKRYAGWNSELGQQILKGQISLTQLAQYAEQHKLAPQHQSGHQEQLENLINHYLLDN